MNEEEYNRLKEINNFRAERDNNLIQENKKLKERIRLLEQVVSPARELYTANEIIRLGDASEDDYFRLTEASDELHEALKELDNCKNVYME